MRVISITASTAAPTPGPTVIPLKSTAGTSITEANYVGGYADGYTSAEPQLLELSLDSALTSTLSAGTYTVVSTVLVAVNGEAAP